MSGKRGSSLSAVSTRMFNDGGTARESPATELEEEGGGGCVWLGEYRCGRHTGNGMSAKTILRRAGGPSPQAGTGKGVPGRRAHGPKPHFCRKERMLGIVGDVNDKS